VRTEAGRDPYDRDLSDLIGDVHRSEPFRARWANHTCACHRTGIKLFHHPSWVTSNAF